MRSPARKNTLLLVCCLSLFVFILHLRSSVIEAQESIEEVSTEEPDFEDEEVFLPPEPEPEPEPRLPQVELDTFSYTVIEDENTIQTSITEHVPGFTIFEHVYMLNGTIFIVSDEPEDVPAIRQMASSGYPVFNGIVEIEKREPSADDMQIISSKKAAAIFGKRIIQMKGVSFIVNDPPQFVNHYYHFSAELLFGIWRAYSSLDTHITRTGKTSLPPPRRFMFPHTRSVEWRDRPRLNPYVFHAVFPETSLEFEEDWKDRADISKTYRFDRVVYADRAASMRGPDYAPRERYASSPFVLEGSPHWWVPVRRNLLQASSLNSRIPFTDSDRPVITYVSRQAWGRRSLNKADHEVLVNALRKLEVERGYEVNIVEMNQLSKDEQILMAGRTTIMMGVHGNGLTALIWMPQNPKTTVMEFFVKDGFTFDYAWTAGALSMNYYGFWGSEYFTSSNLPRRNFPDGFQGTEIPIDGEVVASLCDKILSGQITKQVS